MKCIVIDDEPMALEILEEYIAKTPFLEFHGSFRNAIEGLTYLQSVQVDLLFLDINMPDISGIQLFKSLRNPPLVIFTTAYPDFAIQGFDLHATDYLLKPIEFPRFLSACSKAIEFFNLKSSSSIQVSLNPNLIPEIDQSILIKSGTVTHKVSIKDIHYIEGTGNYIRIWTGKKNLMCLMKMSEIEALLPESFIQIHKSYIINSIALTHFERHQVSINEIDLPIGATYRKSFQQKMEKLIK